MSSPCIFEFVEDPLLQFGQRVRATRHAQKISQEELADLCELDRSYIGGVERGERNVSLLNIVKIAQALKISPKDLFTGVGDSPSNMS